MVDIDADRQLLIHSARELAGGDGPRYNGHQRSQILALALGRCFALVRRETIRRALVREDGSRVRVSRSTARACPRVRDIDPVVSGFLVGIDGHIVALPDPQIQGIGGEGLHGDEVVLDHGHLVADDADGEGVVHAGVDQSKTMALPGGESHSRVVASGSEWVDVGPVEEDVVARWC